MGARLSETFNEIYLTGRYVFKNVTRENVTDGSC